MRLSDPAWRAVMEDSARERGDWAGLGAWRWLVGIRAYAYAYADADAYADAYAYADADAHADADADADAHADADAYADAYAHAYADAYAYADADANHSKQTTEDKMRNGLYAVQVSSAARAVLRVGWFRRDGASDEYDVAWVTPYRGEYQTKLAQVWRDGPKAAPNWTWSPVIECVAHRFHFVPLARLEPKAWARICPRPDGWEP